MRKLFAIALLLVSSALAQTISQPRIAQQTSGVTGGGAKTVTLTQFGIQPIAGDAILVGCTSGNFAATNWSDGVQDTLHNIYTQIGNRSVNGTTNSAVFYLAVNIVDGGFDTLTYTISGSNSANTALDCNAWEIRDAPKTMQAFDTYVMTNATSQFPLLNQSLTSQTQNSYAFEIVTAAGGSCGLAALDARAPWVLDASLAPVGGNNVLSCFGSTPMSNIGVPAQAFNLGGSFIHAALAVSIKSAVSPSSIGCAAAQWTFVRNVANNPDCGLIVETGGRVWVNSNPAVSLQATIGRAAGTNERVVLDQFCFSAVATTAPALTATNIQVTGTAQGVMFQLPVVVTATTGQLLPFACTPPGLHIVSDPGETLTVQFGALVTNVFEGVSAGFFYVH